MSRGLEAKFYQTKDSRGYVNCQLCHDLIVKPIPLSKAGEEDSYTFAYTCGQSGLDLPSNKPPAESKRAASKLGRLLQDPQVVVTAKHPGELFSCPNLSVLASAKETA